MFTNLTPEEVYSELDKLCKFKVYAHYDALTKTPSIRVITFGEGVIKEIDCNEVLGRIQKLLKFTESEQNKN